jgi:hypothetical protein
MQTLRPNPAPSQSHPKESTNDRWWISRADAVSKWATTFAILVAGLWALYHFYLRRESQTALTIDLTVSSVPYMNSSDLVTFDVTLTNKGLVAVRAQRNIRPAFQDNDEVLKYGGDLLVRKVSAELKPIATADWFIADHEHSPHADDFEADLLRIFRDDQGYTDFWMEPAEAYHVGSTLVLAPGNYLVMVTFVGDRKSGTDFWRRVFLIQVPVQAMTPSLGDKQGIGR